MKEVVLVTGASSAVGTACADYLCRTGYAVYRINDGKPESIQGESERADLDDAVAEFVVDVTNREGGVHVLVNCAQYALSGSVEDTSIEEARKLFEMNILHVHRACRAVLPIMRNQRSGLVVNLCYKALPDPFFGFYGATCSALERFTSALHAEVAPFGVNVVMVETGGITAEPLGVHLEARAARTSPVYWDRQKAALDALDQQEGDNAPEAVAVLVERLIRGASLRERILRQRHTPRIGPTLKQVVARPGLAARKNREGKLQVAPAQGRAHRTSFRGLWSAADKEVVQEAIYEYEIRSHLCGTTVSPQHWICTQCHLGTRSIYSANRTGSTSVLTGGTATKLAELITTAAAQLKTTRPVLP